MPKRTPYSHTLQHIHIYNIPHTGPFTKAHKCEHVMEMGLHARLRSASAA